MSLTGPVLLTGTHLTESFDCGRPALNDWLVHRGLRNQALGTSRTWVVVEDTSEQVVAFYASSTASVLRSQAPKGHARNQPEEIPAILLGRMGVDLEYRGQGLGAALLKHFMYKAMEVSERVGVRLVLVHAKDEDAKGFYQHYGFIESPVDPLLLTVVLPRQS